MPKFLKEHPQLPSKKTQGDALALQAEERFQRGRRAYQSGDVTSARREFDAAMDLMLEASDNGPADRQEYEHRLEELADQIHRLDLAGLGAATVTNGRFEKAPLEDILPMTFPVDPKLKDKVREQVAATVSQLPLSVNDTVLGYINYFSNRGHRTIVAGIQRSGRYRPMIQRILDEEGVPQELIHLAQAESGFIPRAMSRKAAGGMWQFVVFRGNEYGLTQTRYTDERMDPEKATRAAARHLHDLYNQFGDWYLAIAAYNCGPGVVQKAVERTGYADFWELRRRAVLPAETTNYVPIILAMTIMEKNAAEYGLTGIQMDPPIEYDTVQTKSLTNLALVSDISETSMAELATLNPAVLKGMVPENFALRVPKGTGNLVCSRLDSIPAEHRDSWRLHRVGAGETVAAIAKRYGTGPNAIVSANNLASSEAMEGDQL
jgi:membrane-bound lytic murein transglycosylase D